MVELKRWIAKDATDHGQLISDSDLTDEAIFERLETDITFRSVATSLVQKYGYLQPSVNPESPMARQQDLLMQERVKWIAQDEEAERAKARQLQQRELNQTQYCDPRTRNCLSQDSGNNPSIQQMPQQQPGMNPLPSDIPGLQNPVTVPPTVPVRSADTTCQRMTELLRTNGGDSLSMGQLRPETLSAWSSTVRARHPKAAETDSGDGATNASLGAMQAHTPRSRRKPASRLITEFRFCGRRHVGQSLYGATSTGILGWTAWVSNAGSSAHPSGK